MSDDVEQSVEAAFDHLTIRVERPDDPMGQVTEADALAALARYPEIVVRGPLFGAAEQRPEDGSAWRVLDTLDSGFPQDARDFLNSHLWLKAKDEADGPCERRELLAAVARLETERIDELTVLGTRYRVVRADEFARIGDDGLEPPRPTDPDREGWDRTKRPPSPTEGFLVDHAAAVPATQAAERLALLPVFYTSDRFPKQVLADSARAVTTHPGVVLLPPTFRVLERKEHSWSLISGLHPTPQDARRSLVFYLREYLPMLTEMPEAAKTEYARAAEEFMGRNRPNELRVRGRRFHITRVERMMRIGHDGPEGPRPSDEDHQEPTKIRPTMDEQGNITYDE
ncbi:DUF5954 family protein [Streptomyces sp. 6N223]|uniref:DUF5954 family protein n=1 Tax=Streptomyces sp. 6N223 TaxID=3457412 RepID=UPI003FD42F96